MRFKMLVMLMLAVAPPLLAAETPRTEVELGYSFLRDTDLEENLVLGWRAAVVGNLSDTLGIVGEVGGNYKTVEDDLGLASVKVNVHSLHAGPRFASRSSASAVPYAQLLAGVTRLAASVDLLGSSGSDSTTKFSIQPGVGVQILANERLAIGLGADYRLIFTEGDKTNEFRVHADLVFRSKAR